MTEALQVEVSRVNCGHQAKQDKHDNMNPSTQSQSVHEHLKEALLP